MKESTERNIGGGLILGLVISLLLIAMPNAFVSILGGIVSFLCLAGLTLWNC